MMFIKQKHFFKFKTVNHFHVKTALDFQKRGIVVFSILIVSAAIAPTSKTAHASLQRMGTHR